MSTTACNGFITVKMTNECRRKIMDLADEMAAAATQKNAQSYDNLMRARKMLETELSGVENTYNF